MSNNDKDLLTKYGLKPLSLPVQSNIPLTLPVQSTLNAQEPVNPAKNSEQSWGEFLSQTPEMFMTGVGNFLSRAGGALGTISQMGKPYSNSSQALRSAGQTLQDYGKKIVDANQYQSELANFEWDDLTTAEGWAKLPRYAIEGFLTSAPEMAATLPIGGLGAKGAGLTLKIGSKIAEKLGAAGVSRAISGKIASEVIQSLGAGYAQSTAVGLLEGGDVYNNAIAQGYSAEEAKEAALEVLSDNIILGIINAPEYAGLFRNRFPNLWKQANKLAPKGNGVLINTARNVGGATLQGVGEGVEEVVQRGSSDAATQNLQEGNYFLGKTIGMTDKLTDKDFYQDDVGAEGVAGFATGFGMSMLGKAGRKIKSSTSKPKSKSDNNNPNQPPSDNPPDNPANNPPDNPANNPPSDNIDYRAGETVTLKDGTQAIVIASSRNGVTLVDSEGNIIQDESDNLIKVENKPKNQDNAQGTQGNIRTIEHDGIQIRMIPDEDNSDNYLVDTGKKLTKQEAIKLSKGLSERFPKMQFTTRDVNENSDDPFAEADWRIVASPIQNVNNDKKTKESGKAATTDQVIPGPDNVFSKTPAQPITSTPKDTEKAKPDSNVTEQIQDDGLSDEVEEWRNSLTEKDRQDAIQYEKEINDYYNNESDNAEFPRESFIKLARLGHPRALETLQDVGIEWDEVEQYDQEPNQNTNQESKHSSIQDENQESNQKTKTADVYEVPINSINVDEGRFQNRSKLDENVLKNIAENYDENQFDPIVIWTDPKDGKNYLLAGHHRLEGTKRTGRKTVKARYFSGTEQEAITYAKRLSNANRTLEKPQDRAKLYRQDRLSGKSKAEIERNAKEIEGANAQFVIDLSYLNEKGKAMQALEQFEASNNENSRKLKDIAQWLGRARRNFSQLTDSHENQLFDYMMENEFRSMGEFIDFVNDKVGRLDFEPDKPLPLTKSKSEIEREYDNRLRELKNEINKIQLERKKRLDELTNKQLEQKKRGIAIGEADLSNNDEITKRLKKYDDEIAALQREILKLESERGNVKEAVKSQVGLFDTIDNAEESLHAAGFTEKQIQTIKDNADVISAEEIESDAERLQSEGNTEQPTSNTTTETISQTDTRQVPEGEVKPKDKVRVSDLLDKQQNKPTFKESDSTQKAREELSALFDEFAQKFGNNLNVGLDPQAIILSGKIIAKGVELGFKVFRDYVNFVIETKGKDFLKSIFSNFKVAYTSYVMQDENNNEDLNAIKRSKIEDYINEPVNEPEITKDEENKVANDNRTIDSKKSINQQIAELFTQGTVSAATVAKMRKNYKALVNTILGADNLKDGFYQQSGEIGDAIMPLSVKVRSLDKYYDVVSGNQKGFYVVIEQNYIQNGDLMSDPKIDYAVYPDLGIVVPLSYEQHVFASGYQEVISDKKLKDPKALQDLTNFTAQWFENLINQGRVFVQSSPEKILPELPDDVLLSSLTPKQKALHLAIIEQLEQKKKIKDTEALIALAKKAGMIFGVDYKDVKELYDLQEFSLNKFILNKYSNFKNTDSKTINKAWFLELINIVSEYESLLATEDIKGEEQHIFQQYSTPLPYSVALSYLLEPNNADVFFEPSAGNGNFAIIEKIFGAEVHVNEITDRRNNFLKALGFDSVSNVDANYIYAMPETKVHIPNKVKMNPPFSREGAKTGDKLNIKTAANHISAMLKLLEDGGRLVAIVGGGMSLDSPAYKKWFEQIANQYDIVANILVSGKLYKGKGTVYDNRVLVFDKPKAGDLVRRTKPITGKAETYTELLDIFEKIKKEIPYESVRLPKPQGIFTGESKSGKSDGQNETKSVRDTNKSKSPISSTTDAIPNTESLSNERQQRPTRVRGLFDDDVSDSQTESSAADATKGTGGRSNTIATNDSGRKRGTTSNVFGNRDSNSGPVNQKPIFSEETDISNNWLNRNKKEVDKQQSDNVGFEPYVPELEVVGTKPHPTPLVESTAMASVSLPNVTYVPKLNEKAIQKGFPSSAQMEDVILAGAAHSKKNPDGTRKGFFLGSGTGYGKGITIASIILDNFNNGRQKAVWISMNDSAHSGSEGYWRDVGGPMYVTDSTGKHNTIFQVKNADEKIKYDKGILLTKYSTLRSKSNKTDRTRIQQIVEWLGKDFDGVIVFDESHEMGNAIMTKGERGFKNPSLKALAGIELQKLLPNARVVYSSATGATEVMNLAYAERLGLWGDGTPFLTVSDFINKIDAAGVSAMEIIAKDLKAMGLYTAKSISFEGVEYEQIKHELLPEQKKLYNKIAKVFQVIFNNIENALEINNATGIGGQSGAVKSSFYGLSQRFFEQIMITMSMPSVIADIQQSIDKGYAPIIQVVSTGEAATTRALNKAQYNADDNEEVNLDEIDLSPKDQIITWLNNAFPTKMYEDVWDDNGNVVKKPLLDKYGNHIENPEAVAIRDRLVKDIEENLVLPESPLDVIINTFGYENVAEVTGRSNRIVEVEENGQRKKIVQSRTKSMRDKEVQDFNDDKRKILIFSKSGGTGASYHADLRIKNQRRRVHYVLQAGWRADVAIQGFGRSHRSNQAIAPIFKLVSTDIKAQMRFLSSIARRLEQLGALTKGQRQTGGQGIIDSNMNLENKYASDALYNTYFDIAKGFVEGVDPDILQSVMGLNIYSEDSPTGFNDKEMRNTKRFLNRIVSLDIDTMNTVFDYFMDNLNKVIEDAKNKGTYDEGIQIERAIETRVVNEEVIYSDETLGQDTKIVELELDRKADKLSWTQLNEYIQRSYPTKFRGFFINNKSGNVYAVVEGPKTMNADGTLTTKVILLSAAGNKSYLEDYKLISNYSPVIDTQQAKKLWDKLYEEAPDIRTDRHTIIEGLMLPIWNKLPESVDVRRYVDSNGLPHLGRYLKPKDAQEVRKKFKTIGQSTYNNELAVNELKKGGKVVLYNNITIESHKLANEKVYRLDGKIDYSLRNRIKSYGLQQQVLNAMYGKYLYYVHEADLDAFLDNIIRIANTDIYQVYDADGNLVPAQTISGKKDTPRLRMILEESPAEYNSTPDKDFDNKKPISNLLFSDTVREDFRKLTIKNYEETINRKIFTNEDKEIQYSDQPIGDAINSRLQRWQQIVDSSEWISNTNRSDDSIPIEDKIIPKGIPQKDKYKPLGLIGKKINTDEELAKATRLAQSVHYEVAHIVIRDSSGTVVFEQSMTEFKDNSVAVNIYSILNEFGNKLSIEGESYTICNIHNHPSGKSESSLADKKLQVLMLAWAEEANKLGYSTFNVDRGIIHTTKSYTLYDPYYDTVVEDVIENYKDLDVDSTFVINGQLEFNNVIKAFENGVYDKSKEFVIVYADNQLRTVGYDVFSYGRSAKDYFTTIKARLNLLSGNAIFVIADSKAWLDNVSIFDTNEFIKNSMDSNVFESSHQRFPLRNKFSALDINNEFAVEEPSSVNNYKSSDQEKLLAPNGKPSNLTPAQYRQVRTPEFKKWFGDWENDPENASKVVDENGEPLVMYHGTDQDFSVFDTQKKVHTHNTQDAIFTTDNAAVAQTYSRFDRILTQLEQEEDQLTFNTDDEYDEFVKKRKAIKNKIKERESYLRDNANGGKWFLEGGNIMALFVKAMNPLIVDAKGNFWFNVTGTYPNKSIHDIIRQAKKEGKDGVIVKNVFDFGKTESKEEKKTLEQNPSTDVIVFNPNQVKSATGNTGTFDSNNDDIRFKLVDNTSNTFNEVKQKFLQYRKVAHELTKDWKNAPQINFYVDFDEFLTIYPELSYLKDSKVSGLYTDGQIHVFLDNIDSVETLQKTILHEMVGHYGLQGFFKKVLSDDSTTDEYNQILDEIYFSIIDKPLAKKIAKNYFNKPITELTLKESRILAEEYIAHLAETNPQATIVQKLVALIRRIMRKIPSLKRYVNKLNDAELITLISMSKTWVVNLQGQLEPNFYTRLYILTQNKNKFNKGSDHRLSYLDSGYTNSIPENTDVRLKLLDTDLGTANEPPIIEYKRFDNAVRYWVDKMIDLKRLQETKEKQGAVITDNANPYLMEETHYGRVDAKRRDFWHQFAQPFIKTMSEITDKANVNYDDISEYLYAKYAPIRNEEIYTRNREALETKIERHQNVIKSLEQQIEKLNAELNNLQDNNKQSAIQEEIDNLKRRISWRKGQITKLNKKINGLNRAASGMSDAEAAAIVAKFKSKVNDDALLDKLHEQVKAMTDFIAQTWYDSGLISKQRYQMMLDSQYYVPLRGFEEVIDHDETVFTGDMRALGRKSRAGDVIAYIFAMSDTAIIRGEKNKIMQAMVEFAKDNPDLRAYKVKNVWFVPTGEIDEDTGKEIYDAVTERPDANVPASRDIDWDKAQVHWRNTEPKKSIRAYYNGRPVIVTFNHPEIPNALSNIGVEKIPVFLKHAAKFMRFLRKTYTQYSPEFAIRNFIRDSIEGFIHLIQDFDIKTAQAIVNPNRLRKVMAGMRQIIRNKTYQGEWAEWYKRFEDAGGRAGMWQLETVSEHTNKLRKLAKRSSNKGVIDTSARGWRAFLDVVEDYNAIVENAVRVSTFRYLVEEKGYTELQAASYAKNLTVNFNRKGNGSSWAGTLYLFFNAGVQGIARVIKPFKSSDPSIRRKATLTPIIMAGSAFMWMEMIRVVFGEGDDEENYVDKQSTWMLTHNVIIPNILSDDPNDYFRLPLPYSYNFYWTIGVIANQFAHGIKSLGESAMALADVAMGSFSPIGGIESDDPGVAFSKLVSPTLLDPILELSMNENFAGSPIYKEQSRFARKLPKSEVYYDSANEVFVEIAKAINRLGGGNEVELPKFPIFDVSPEVLEYITGQVTGGTGQFFMKTVDFAKNLIEGDAFDGDKIRKIPLASAFMGDTSPYADVRTFYNRYDKLKAKYDTWRNYVEFAPEKAGDYFLNNKEDISDYFKAKAILSMFRNANDVEAFIKRQQAAEESDKPIRDAAGQLMIEFNKEKNRERKLRSILD